MHILRLPAAATLIGLAGCAAQPHRVNGVQAVRAQVDQLAWLVGVWQPTSPGGPTEVWAAPENHTLHGFSVSHHDNAVDEFELLAIQQRGRSVVYLARPNGLTPSTPFALVEIGAASAVFANPQHDFPQRIGYSRDGDELTAWIEGPGPEGPRRLSWQWSRRSP